MRDRAIIQIKKKTKLINRHAFVLRTGQRNGALVGKAFILCLLGRTRGNEEVKEGKARCLA